jgi:hypothetical protein
MPDANTTLADCLRQARLTQEPSVATCVKVMWVLVVIRRERACRGEDAKCGLL